MDTDAELLNLSWKDYHQSTTKTFQNLLGDEIFADVTLACGKGQQLKAHKVILSSCSPFFRNILVQNPHQHPILYLTGVDMEDLESLMKFIYQGEVQIENEGLAKFLDTANDLEVDGLFQKKEPKLEEEIDEPKPVKSEKVVTKEKPGPKKKLEEWEVEKKTRKRKNKGNSDDAKAKKVTRTSTENKKTSERIKRSKKPQSWLNYIDAENDVNKVNDESLCQSKPIDYIVDHVDINAEVNVLEGDSDIDTLEVEFPEDLAESVASTSRHACEHCPKTFSRKADAERHIKKYHSQIESNGIEESNLDVGNTNATACDICAKVFTTKWSMQEHRDSVHEGIRFICDHCDHIASSKRNLRGHMGKKHPNTPLPSTYTSIRAEDTDFEKNFTNFQDDDAQMYELEAFDHELEEKLEGMAEKKGNIWSCLECGKTAGTKFHLKRHAETHLEGFTHTCLQCYKSFGTRPALKQHFDSHHKEHKPTKAGYACDMCDKTSVSRGALRIHKYRHHTIA